jgi:hypothetical protein
MYLSADRRSRTPRCNCWRCRQRRGKSRSVTQPQRDACGPRPGAVHLVAWKLSVVCGASSSPCSRVAVPCQGNQVHRSLAGSLGAAGARKRQRQRRSRSRSRQAASTHQAAATRDTREGRQVSEQRRARSLRPVLSSGRPDALAGSRGAAADKSSARPERASGQQRGVGAIDQQEAAGS